MARISCVAAARPNFMKVAPVIAALPAGSWELVHTGQHYDENMSDAFFRDLDIPSPDVSLGVGSGTHGEQTAGVLLAYEKHLFSTRPDAVVVVGDVNSTLGASLAASKLNIPVAHVEAGLRSRDWTMPEEVNRVLTDRLSRWLFTPSADADENLAAEGIAAERVHRVGNVMIDTLMRFLPRARERWSRLSEELGVLPQGFALLTLHRPNNVDDLNALRRILGAVEEIAQWLPVLFPVHPRTVPRLKEIGLDPDSEILVTDPLGYLDFVGLLDSAALALTDSGGIQEETSVLGVPCLTLRHNTERPITVELGTNRVVGSDPDAIVEAARQALDGEWSPAEIPLWDGKSAERIAQVLIADLGLDQPTFRGFPEFRKAES